MDPFLAPLRSSDAREVEERASDDEANVVISLDEDVPDGEQGNADGEPAADGAAWRGWHGDEDDDVPLLLRGHSFDSEGEEEAMAAAAAVKEAAAVADRASSARPELNRTLSGLPSLVRSGSAPRGGGPSMARPTSAPRGGRASASASGRRERAASALPRASSESAAADVQFDGRTRVLVAVHGYRGETQPLLAVAHRLLASGHGVSFCCGEGFKEMAEHYLSADHVYPLRGDHSKIFQTEAFKEAYYSPEPASMDDARALGANIEAQKESNYRRLWKAVQRERPHIIVSSLSLLGICGALAQRAVIPVVAASPIPVHPSGELGPVHIGNEPGGNALWNKMQHWAIEKMMVHLGSKSLNVFREEFLNMPKSDPLWIESFPLLHLYSEHVFPSPADWPDDAIPPLGYLRLPELPSDTPNAAALAFLERGTKPVYVGFGLLPLEDVAAFVSDLEAVMHKLELRAIFSVPSDSLKDVVDLSSDRVCIVGEVRHEWLFPKCLLAVHHGGAGTLGAALCAGIPSVVFWMIADQRFWAARVLELGVGHSRVCSMLQLSAHVLEEQIIAARQDTVQEKARALGTKLRAERGLEEVETFLMEHVRKHGNSDGVECVWLDDDDVDACPTCGRFFTFVRRRHHCRRCGGIFCSFCIEKDSVFMNWDGKVPLCKRCWGVVHGVGHGGL